MQYVCVLTKLKLNKKRKNKLTGKIHNRPNENMFDVQVSLYWIFKKMRVL